MLTVLRHPRTHAGHPALAAELDVRQQTHPAETIDEEDFCRERFGLRTMDYLESVGWLSSCTWLGHAIHLDDSEIKRLGAAGVGVAHCATSNIRLGSRTCRALELEEAGSPVGLGVVGSARALGWEGISALAPGSGADLALFTRYELRFAGLTILSRPWCCAARTGRIGSWWMAAGSSRTAPCRAWNSGASWLDRINNLDF
ncbi:amidohydrolase family protein [Kocuria sp. cx-455]|uniref:amidohydrolase family protein n=1 Tax=Kocuria sp. cx-455 TaxID=2771377 RepID=UPI0028055191|nr:amidohydrolase family protein [Kocuria sp. cx-455]